MLPYALTIFLSAFLLFLVQPLIAKQILPWFGGAASVWTTCLLFSKARCWPAMPMPMPRYAGCGRVSRSMCMRR